MDNEKHSKVLIVDDTTINRLILSSLLASYGVDSDLAEGGKECIELCKNNKYDLILLDHRMPDLDGVETLIQLKEIFKAQGNDVPVICHTTEEARSIINLYKAAGFADILIKPIQPQELSDILMEYLPEGSISRKHHEEEEQRLNREIALLPDWLNNYPYINLHSGIEHCDTAKDYMDALSIFVNSIDEKSNEIESFSRDSDLDKFTLKAHSLKSMSRLIGADDIADLSAELELAGKKNDKETINQKTPQLLSEYRALLSIKEHLACNAIPDNSFGNEASSDKMSADAHTGITENTLKDAYNAISDFIECYDFESINMVLDSLNGYNLSENDNEKINNIKSALSQSDWEKLRDIMNL